MRFKRVLGSVLLIIGIVVFIFGAVETSQFSEKLVKELSGEYSHSTLYPLIGGFILIAIGGLLILLKKKKT